MLLSVVSVLVVAQSGSEVPEGLMNNPVCVGIWSVITKSHDFITTWCKTFILMSVSWNTCLLILGLNLSLNCLIHTSLPHDNADVADVWTGRQKLMCESHLQEIYSHSVDQNNPLLLRNPEIYFHVHKCPPLDCNLSIISSTYIVHHAFQDKCSHCHSISGYA